MLRRGLGPSRATTWAAAITLVGGSVIGGFAGCSLSTDGVSSPRACGVDSDCTDDNPCTLDTCEATNGTCVFTATPDGAPLNPVQGDCQQVECAGGKPTAKPDPTDVDDGDPCTADSCPEGAPQHTPEPDDAPCILGTLSGSCQAGKCEVKCQAGDLCDDTNPCTKDSCNGTICVNDAVADGTPVADPSDTDCVEDVCLAGKVQTVADDSEIHEDDNDCTTNGCASSNPVHDPLDVGTPCGTNGKCNGAGACVGCNTNADCGITDACTTSTCTANVCDVSHAPSGTPAGPNGALNDCKQMVCDGSGGEQEGTDSGDPPTTDNNECTSDTCVGDVPSHVPVAQGTACNAVPGGKCNSNGICVECLGDGDCTTAAGGKCGALVPGSCCYPVTCADLGLTCGSASDTCGGTLDCNNGVVDGGETDVDCGGSCATKCGTAKTCTGNGDCVSGSCPDGICCSASCNATCRSCTNALTGQPNGTCANIQSGTPDPGACDGIMACDGAGSGAAHCKLVNGQTCGTTNGLCASNKCADTVCCDTTCTALCRACVSSKTGQPDGTCAGVTNLTDPDKECGGSACCNGSGMCGGSDPSCT